MSAPDRAAPLREAAVKIRRDQDTSEQLGRIDADEYATWLAVADWLDHCAHTVEAHEAVEQVPVFSPAALAVARAYLGPEAHA